jgi:hypothetical protein
MSIIRSHFNKVTAEKTAVIAKEKGQTVTDGSPANNMLVRLRSDELNLKQIKSQQTKIEMKREFLPEYEAYVDGMISSGTGLQDLVVTTVMIWRLDVGDLKGCLQLAEYVLAHDLKLPDRFNRDAATFILEDIATLCENSKPEGDEATAFVEALQDALLLTENADMPDEVRAKAYKQLGYLVEKQDPALALEHLKAAFEFDPKCGVKTKITSLDKVLKAIELSKNKQAANKK